MILPEQSNRRKREFTSSARKRGRKGRGNHHGVDRTGPEWSGGRRRRRYTRV